MENPPQKQEIPVFPGETLNPIDGMWNVQEDGTFVECILVQVRTFRGPLIGPIIPNNKLTGGFALYVVPRLVSLFDVELSSCPYIEQNEPSAPIEL